MSEPTTPLVIEKHDGFYYTGDLDAAKAYLHQTYPGGITERENPDTGRITVFEHWCSDDYLYWNQYGSGSTSDEAWRYLAGTDFGPLDENYDDDRLRGLLDRYVSTATVPLDLTTIVDSVARARTDDWDDLSPVIRFTIKSSLVPLVAATLDAAGVAYSKD